MRCPVCDATYSGDHRFCANDGSPLVAEVPADDVAADEAEGLLPVEQSATEDGSPAEDPAEPAPDELEGESPEGVWASAGAAPTDLSAALGVYLGDTPADALSVVPTDVPGAEPDVPSAPVTTPESVGLPPRVVAPSPHDVPPDAQRTNYEPPPEYAAPPLPDGPPFYPPPAAISPRRLPLALVVLAVVAVLSLGVAVGTLLSRRNAGASIPPSPTVTPTSVGTDQADVVVLDDQATDAFMMADTTMEMDGGGMEGETMDDVMIEEPTYRPPPPSEPSGYLQAGVPGGVALAQYASDGTTIISVQRGASRRVMPQTLSASTRLNGLTSRALAGRHTVEIRASDNRWTTTYYWDYDSNVLHFVAEDRTTGAVNVSREAGTAQVMQAALGYVPTRTFRTRAERRATARSEAPARRPPAPAATAPAYVILGAYLPGDEAGYQERLARLQPSGRDIQTTMSENLSMQRSGYRLLYLGPFERSTAERVRAEMQRYAADAYLRSVR